MSQATMSCLPESNRDMLLIRLALVDKHIHKIDEHSPTNIFKQKQISKHLMLHKVDLYALTADCR